MSTTMPTDDSQNNSMYQDTQPIDYDPILHAPPPYEPFTRPTAVESYNSQTIIRKASLLTEAPAFDEDAINAEFQEEYNRLEEQSRTLDLQFQDLVKHLRLWIAASVTPLDDAAKARIAEEVEAIKVMEGNQENVRVRIVDCMKAVETALSLLNHSQIGD